MKDLKLDLDEGIIIQTTNVERYKADDKCIYVNELYLTTKNLIIIYEKSNGMFKKSEVRVEKIPLTDIKVVNGKVQIFKKNDNHFGLGLQILFNNGDIEHFVFLNNRREIKKWMESIIETITGEKIKDDESNQGYDFIEIASSGIINGIQKAISSTKVVMGDIKTQVLEEFNEKKSPETNSKKKQPINTEKLKQYIYCSSCGEKLNSNSKFCNACGKPINIIENRTSKKNYENEEKTIEEVKQKKENIISENKQENEKKIIEEEKVQKEKNINKDNDDKGETTERKTVYVGKIRKCPNCGEILKSFVTNCPACGFEINEKKIADSLQKFIDKINECEKVIAESSSNASSGWASWSKSKRFWWVILNIWFLCIPLAIYLSMSLIQIKIKPKLTKEENQLQLLVENFPFPNDRESITAALIFAKEKIDFISNENLNRKNVYWIKLWSSKAEQLKQRADMLFPNDSIVEKTYEKIIINENKLDRKIKIKAMIGIIIIILSITFFAVNYINSENSEIIDNTDYSATMEWQDYGLFKKLPKPLSNNGKVITETDENLNIEIYNSKLEDFDNYVKSCRSSGYNKNIVKNEYVFYSKDSEGYNLDIFYDEDRKVMDIHLDSYNVKSNKFEIDTYETFNVMNYSFDIPNYWKEKVSEENQRVFYGETGGKVAMLSINYPEETDDNYDVSFEGLKADNENMKKAIKNIFTDASVYEDEEFESDYGVRGILYKFNFKQKIGMVSKTDGKGMLFCYPSMKDRRWFYVSVSKTNNIDNKKYEEDYLKILSSIKEK